MQQVLCTNEPLKGDRVQNNSWISFTKILRNEKVAGLAGFYFFGLLRKVLDRFTVSGGIFFYERYRSVCSAQIDVL